MTADINNPTLTVAIEDLAQASDLCGILKAHGVKKYAYAIKHLGQIVKIGMSADNAYNHGDRIYRQVANIPGWSTVPRSGCGKDILEVINDYQREMGVNIHKDDCTIEVWDVTHVEQLSMRPQRTAEDAENELLDQYEEIHGRLPIGNPKDTRKITGKPFVPARVFDQLFKFEVA